MTITIDTTGHGSPTAVLRAHAAYQLVLTEHVCAGSRLFRIEGELTHTPTRYSVQVDQDLHIDIPSGYAPDETLDRFYWRFTNHSCEPNAVVCGRDMYARICIEPWQQITFNYNTTEYDMAEPFDCLCGSDICEKTVRGFRWLSPTAQQRLHPMLAGHLRSMLDGVPAQPVIPQANPCR
jgi:SET domain